MPPDNSPKPDLDEAAEALKKVLAILSKLNAETRNRVVSTVVTFYPQTAEK